MTARPDIDRVIVTWLTEVAPEGHVDYLDETLVALDGIGQRPAWANPATWIPGRLAPRAARPRHAQAILILALLLIASVIAAVVVGSRLVNPPPLPVGRLGHLAYALDGDIFVADWDGSDAVRVADGLPGGQSGCGSAGFWAEGPMWSPDGRHFAYRSPRDGGQPGCPVPPNADRVFLSDEDGRVVKSFPGVGWQVAWSPDSTRVATSLDLYPVTRIGVYGIDGTLQATLSLPAGTKPPGDYDPVWSPDGESLLIPLMTTGGSDSATWEVPIDGRAPRPLPADDPRSQWLGARSPDGARVAYVIPAPFEGSGTLVVAANDGSDVRELVSGATHDWSSIPRWSPTGDRIAFVAGGSWTSKLQPDGSHSEFLDATTMDLRIVDLSTEAVTTLVPAGTGDGMDVIRFSPEGDRVLFAKYSADGQSRSLWSVNTDGSDVRRLVDGLRFQAGDWQSLPFDPSSGDAQPLWSPEGLP